jgi:hypothetical protein
VSSSHSFTHTLTQRCDSAAADMTPLSSDAPLEPDPEPEVDCSVFCGVVLVLVLVRPPPIALRSFFVFKVAKLAFMSDMFTL